MQSLFSKKNLRELNYTLIVVSIQWFGEITTFVSDSVILIIFVRVKLSHILKLNDSVKFTMCDVLEIGYLNLHRANDSKTEGF